MPIPRLFQKHLREEFDIKLTEEQRYYVDSIFDNKVTVVNAKSGTGKTTLAVAVAQFLHNKDGRELMYIFNPTEERKMGYRKGSQEEKEEAYLTPLKDALLEINENPMQVIRKEEMTKEQADKCWVTACSHIFARGTNIKNKIVIIDEAQNFTTHDLRKVLTRVHDDCTVIIIGHTGQIDLDKPHTSGFLFYIELYRHKHYSTVCELTKNFRGEISRDADEIDEVIAIMQSRQQPPPF